MIGNVTLEQLGLLLDVLPMELAFIDADDNVRLWNRTSERGPAWQPEILGGTVETCHRPESVKSVRAVLARLKSGARDVIDRQVVTERGITRFRWFAVRSESGEYLGTLELVQYGAEVAPAARVAGDGGAERPIPVMRYFGGQSTDMNGEEVET